jgi:hypothetical protein
MDWDPLAYRDALLLRARLFAQRGRLLEATVYNIEADMCLAAWWTLRHGKSEAERLVLVYWADE